MERRMTALEPQEDPLPSFDTLVRSRTGWGAPSSTGKAKVDVTGEVSLGTAVLWSKVAHFLFVAQYNCSPEAHCMQRTRQLSCDSLWHIFWIMVCHVTQHLACYS